MDYESYMMEIERLNPGLERTRTSIADRDDRKLIKIQQRLRSQGWGVFDASFMACNYYESLCEKLLGEVNPS